jgi:hypothetical protein
MFTDSSCIYTNPYEEGLAYRGKRIGFPQIHRPYYDYYEYMNR